MPVHFFYMQDEMGQESERGYSRVFQRENGKRGLKNDLEYFWMYYKSLRKESKVVQTKKQY